MPHDISRRTAIKDLCMGAALAIPGASLLRHNRVEGYEARAITEAERRAMAVVAESFRKRFNAPGLSIAIARAGRFEYVEAFGTTGHDSRQELTTSALFRIASVTKPITSAAIFSLIEDGLLRIDETVFGARGILGTRYGHQPYGPGIEQITVDHLLTHSSGGWGPGHDPMFFDTSLNQSELISRALDTQPLLNPPGKVCAYSNFGYCLLGRIIEKTSGVSYAEYVQRRILSRSGIADMRVAGNTIRDRAPNEVEYYGQDEPTSSSPYELNVTRMDSNGGWIASASDLVRFGTHVDGFDAARNILRPETIARMFTPSPAKPSYARGWNVNAGGNRWHGGDLAGTTAILVSTSTNFCWAALANTRVAGSTSALDDMVWEMVRKVGAWKSA
jgi:CubicO group peptidase (beta-lactamase class C family)